MIRPLGLCLYLKVTDGSAQEHFRTRKNVFFSSIIFSSRCIHALFFFTDTSPSATHCGNMRTDKTNMILGTCNTCNVRAKLSYIIDTEYRVKYFNRKSNGT